MTKIVHTNFKQFDNEDTVVRHTTGHTNLNITLFHAANLLYLINICHYLCVHAL